ncbi:MAG: class I SAM-dependent methyltransferase [Bacteroidota bacterium]
MNIFQKQDIADSYDDYYDTDFGRNVDFAEKMIISELEQIIPVHDNLLEVGCGTGHWTAFFVEKGYRVTGVDSSQSMLAVAQKKNIAADFVLAASEQLPFEDETFSVVVSITMLEFVANKNSAIKEMHRVLKKGGRMIIGGLYSHSILGENKDSDSVFKHAHLFDEKDLYSLFSEFKILKMREGVYINEEFEFIDSEQEIKDMPPLFFGLLLQKKI